MKSRTGPVCLIVAGVVLALGPVWGVFGTIFRFVRAFVGWARLGASSSEPLWSGRVGMVMVPVGVLLLVAGIVWLRRMGRGKGSDQSSVNSER